VKPEAKYEIRVNYADEKTGKSGPRGKRSG